MKKATDCFATATTWTKDDRRKEASATFETIGVKPPYMKIQWDWFFGYFTA